MSELQKKELDYVASTQTLVGSQKRRLVDQDTGEIIEVDQVTKRIYGQANFWKVYLMDFLAVLGVFDSKQADVFVYIVRNTNPNSNLFLGTYKKISKDVGVSEVTISKIMKKLQEHKFIKKVQNGAWLVNPNIMMKGNDNKRQMLINYFEADEPIEKINKEFKVVK